MRNKMVTKMMVIMMAALMVLGMTGCGSTGKGENSQAASNQASAEASKESAASKEAANNGAKEGGSEVIGENVQIPNPFVEYGSLEEAIKAAGFELVVPTASAGYENVIYQVMNGEMIEVIYKSAESESGESVEAYRIRKQAGEGNISGDYNNYAEINEVDVNGTTVTLKGNDGKVFLATWTVDGYSYSLSIDMDGAGMTADEVTALVGQIK